MKKALLTIISILLISTCIAQKTTSSKVEDVRNSELNDNNTSTTKQVLPQIAIKNLTNGDIPFIVQYKNSITANYRSAVNSGSTSILKLDEDCTFIIPGASFSLKMNSSYELYIDDTTKKLLIRYAAN